MRFWWPIMESAWLQLIKPMNTDQQTEEWVKVHGYPDYEVSSLGEVRRPVGGWRKSANGLKQRVHNGYPTLMLGNKITRVYSNLSVHRLVATAFIPNADNLPCVNHKDGNQSNNNRDNLEWVTHKQNSDHAVLIGLINHSCENNGRHILSVAQVMEIVAQASAGAAHRMLAEKYNVAKSTISHVLTGKTWSSVTGIKQQPKLAAA